MCGIVGYLGQKDALKPVVSGLKALEYRGYDSAGVAYLDEQKGFLVKQVGRVEQLENAVASKVKTQPKIAIGHTRWATHGAPTIINAHPHYNQDKTIFVVHNGIVENFAQIREKLQKLGYEFISQTDTEVIPQLIDYHYKKSKNFEKAFEQTLH